MTYANQSGHAVAPTSIRQRLSDLTMGLGQRRAQSQAYHSTVRELSAMSERELTDIGIHRADIHTIAQQVAYGS
jgi:uncharacterized protein YjiS (DUF1127 family)